MSPRGRNLGAKPVGLKGMVAGRIMNLIHGSHYKRIIRECLPRTEADQHQPEILDIGCGGGKTVQLFAGLYSSAHVCGIDHSPEMVKLSRTLNNAEVFRGRVEITQGDVHRLPFADGRFDLVSAFDTVNFWEDTEMAFTEVRRVLKQRGMFLIVNAFPKQGSAWWDFVKFKNEDQYRSALLKSGFSEASSRFDKNTIIIQAFV